MCRILNKRCVVCEELSEKMLVLCGDGLRGNICVNPPMEVQKMTVEVKRRHRRMGGDMYVNMKMFVSNDTELHVCDTCNTKASTDMDAHEEGFRKMMAGLQIYANETNLTDMLADVNKGR